MTFLQTTADLPLTKNGNDCWISQSSMMQIIGVSAFSSVNFIHRKMCNIPELQENNSAADLIFFPFTHSHGILFDKTQSKHSYLPFELVIKVTCQKFKFFRFFVIEPFMSELVAILATVKSSQSNFTVTQLSDDSKLKHLMTS